MISRPKGPPKICENRCLPGRAPFASIPGTVSRLDTSVPHGLLLAGRPLALSCASHECLRTDPRLPEAPNLRIWMCIPCLLGKRPYGPGTGQPSGINGACALSYRYRLTGRSFGRRRTFVSPNSVGDLAARCLCLKKKGGIWPPGPYGVAVEITDGDRTRHGE